MQKLFNILILGLSFVVLNVATVAAQTDSLPMADSSAAPIGKGGETGGPAAQDMSGNMINDGGHGANSGLEAEDERAVAEQNCIKYVKKWEPNSKDHTESWCYDKGWEVHKNSCSAAEPC